MSKRINIILVLVLMSLTAGLHAQADLVKDVTINVDEIPVLSDYNGIGNNPLTKRSTFNLLEIVQNPSHDGFMGLFRPFYKFVVCYDEALVARLMDEPLVAELRAYINSLGIITEHGILKFGTPCCVEKVYDDLIEYSQRWDNQITENSAAYRDYIESENFPRDPMLFAFEKITGFHSLRAKIENELLELEAGDGIPDGNNPDDHFIVSDYMRTLLTPDCEIIVGDNIFLTGRYQDAVIYDSDFDKLEQTKDLWRQHGEVNGTVMAVKQGLAEPLLSVSEHKSGDDEDPCTALCQKLDIDYKLLSPSDSCPYKYQFTVKNSWVGICNCTYSSQDVTWYLGDGTRKYGSSVTHEYKTGGTYNVKMEISLLEVNGGYKTCTKNVTLKLDNCNITINTPVKDNSYTGSGARYMFSANAFGCSGTPAQYTWKFGTTITKTTTTDTTSHIYTMNGTNFVSVTVDYGDCSASTEQHTFNVIGTGNCCKNKHYDEKNDRYRDFVYHYDISLWVRHFFTTRQGPLWHRIVVKNNFYKKRSNGNWYSQNAYKMFANFSGEISDTEVPCSLKPIYPNGCWSNDKNSLTYDYGVGKKFWIGKESIKSAFSIEMFKNGATDSKTDVIKLHDAVCP